MHAICTQLCEREVMEAELRYIYEVYKTGSFSRAAENLFVTQPALSKSIRRTEESIGMAIFERKQHPLQLTEAGESYIRAIEKILLIEKDLADEISDIRNLESGSVLIGGSNYVNTSILPDILTRFQMKYPNIKIRLVEASSAHLSKLLAGNELDLTFSCNKNFVKDFKKREAFRDCLLMAVPWNCEINEKLSAHAYTAADILEGRHLLGERSDVGIEAFRQLPLIALDEGNNLYDRMREIYQEAGFDPDIRIVLQQMTTAFKLAESGYGITITCDRLVKASYTDLRFYSIRTPLSERIFYMLLPNRAYTPVAVKRFMEFFDRNV